MEGNMAKYETKQRKVFLEYLSKHLDEQLTAIQIADDLKSSGISRSAVYRNLSDLELEKKIHKYNKEGSREMYYRYSGDAECRDALHLSCTECGCTFHMDQETADNIIGRIARSEQFVVDKQETVIYGICINCLKKRKRNVL